MKHLFTFLLLAISATSFAQGNLQFNQVVNLDFSGLNVVTSTITVPAGKVWKVNHAGALSTFAAPGNYPVRVVGSFDYISIDNYVIYLPHTNGQSAELPLWLGAGDYDMLGRFTTGDPVSISISAIEFNIVP